MPDNSTILNNAPISCVLAGNDISKGVLFGSRLDTQLSQKIYATYTIIKKIYDIDPNYNGMTQCCLYLWELMGKYGIGAMAYTGGGGSISPITPSTPIKSPIRITSDDFVSETEWEGANSDGIEIQASYTLQVFANFIARYLEQGVEWERTLTGINILLPGFDALTTDYEFYIDISA